MKNHYRVGPFVVRVGSKNLAPWGFPRLAVAGLSFWSWTNSGDLLLATYHPARSITWLWYAGIGRRGGRLRIAPKAERLGQWHHYMPLPFGFTLIIGRQRAMWRKPKPKAGSFLPDWRRRVADDQCPVCGGELDTGWECNDCGFDAILIAQTEGRRPNA